MRALLSSHLDYLVFAGLSMALLAIIHYWLHKRAGGNRTQWIAWAFLMPVLAGGWFATDRAGKGEQQRLREMVEGLPPTYAQEMQRLGHARLTLETAADDPLYTEMIEAEKRWLSVIRSVNDIYTFRKLPEGKIVLMVDSETDYDRNGKFEGEREQRTAIGEEYPNPSPTLMRAFEGEASFDDAPYTDRWGTWVSAYSPIFGPDGKVEAVLGVDYSASAWVAAMKRARMTVIGYLSVLVILIAAATGVTAFALASGEVVAHGREKEQLRLSRKKFETLVNSIDGIVWEADPNAFHFTFVSQQAEAILGYTQEQWLASQTFWADHLHPEDRWAIEYGARMVANENKYQYDYRMLAADGRTVWIRESAAVLYEGGSAVLVRGVFLDITEQKLAAEELESAHQKLIESSRHAGMAEVATGVLHNVGNVLNSVNVSSTLISDRVRSSQVGNLAKVAALLREQGEGLAAFIASDPRGKAVPGLIASLTDALAEEQVAITREVGVLTRNVAHIKDIVAMQQSYAKVSGLMEPLSVSGLVGDALQINAASLSRHEVTVERKFEEVPAVLVDKHKVLQILVNLIRNAKQSLDDSANPKKLLTIGIRAGEDGIVRISITDTGMGIAPDNLERIFSHGFTTKKNGHGFGLHSGANSAQEMGGSLIASSDGPGLGATFTLELPIAGVPKEQPGPPVAASADQTREPLSRAAA